MPSNHLILCCPLLLSSLFPSIRVFSNELTVHIRWPKYWSFGFGISPSNEYSGLISFWIDWLDLAVQGTLKSLLQHHSSKASILWRSAFFMVQLSYPLISYYRKWSLSEKRIFKYIRTQSLHLLLSNITNSREKEVCFSKEKRCQH